MSIQIRDEQDIVQMGKEYANRILELQKQIAEIQADIKVVKTDAKLDGIPVSIIDKALTRMKKEQKQSEAQKSEEEIWYEKLKEAPEIEDKIAEINNP